MWFAGSYSWIIILARIEVGPLLTIHGRSMYATILVRRIGLARTTEKFSDDMVSAIAKTHDGERGEELTPPSRRIGEDSTSTALSCWIHTQSSPSAP